MNILFYTWRMTLAYDYYPAVMYAIDLISQGRTKTYACDEANITIKIFDTHVNLVPELQDLLVEAETRGYDAMADMLLTIDNHGIYAQSDPKMAKVISDNIKWLLEKRRAKQYGQRVDVNVNLTADKAITDALIAGRNRALASIEAPVIEAQYVTMTEDDILMAELLS